MIETHCLVKKFGKVTALDRVSEVLHDKETISLIGPNASGKTTLIKSLLGLVIPESGKIIIDGVNIRGNSIYRNSIGYMPQHNRFPENIRVAQLLDMIRDIRNIREREDRDLLDVFSIDKIKDKVLRTLSGGTRQKVSACLAFMFNPSIIILDEPTAGLDPLSAEYLKEKIRTEKENGKLILITSHILSDLDEITTRVMYMQDGAVLFHKTIEQLREDTGELKLAKAIAQVMKTNPTFTYTC